MKDGSTHKIKASSLPLMVKKCVKLNKAGGNIYVDLPIHSNSGTLLTLTFPKNKDFDNLKAIEELPEKPNLVIQEGQDAYQVYYLVSECEQEQLESLQKELQDKVDWHIDVGRSDRIKVLLSGFINHNTREHKVSLVSSSKSPVKLKDLVLSYGLEDVWPMPEPVKYNGVKPLKLKDFMMPNAMSTFVFDAARSFNCAPDFVCIPLLIFIGSVISHRIHAQPTEDKQNIVACNNWGMSIGVPGTGKSPVVEFMKEIFIEPLEAMAEKESEKRMKRIKSTNSINSMVMANVKKEIKILVDEALANGVNKQNKLLLAKARAKLEKATIENEELARVCFVVTSITYASLYKVISENPGGCLLHMDELNGLLEPLTKSGNGALRAFLLECYSGFSSHKMDRITRNCKPAKNMMISIIGSIQPTKLEPYLAKVLDGSSEDDGWFNRFLLSVYPEELLALVAEVPPIRESIIKYFKQFFMKLYEEDFGFEREVDVKKRSVRFCTKAQDEYFTWIAEIRHRAADIDMHPAMRSHLKKYETLVPSLALIFDVIKTFKRDSLTFTQIDKISLSSTIQAISFTHYLESHAKRLFDVDANITAINAATIAERLHKLPETFTASEVAQRNWVGINRSTEKATEALELLAKSWSVRAINSIPKKSGKPTTRWEKNPYLKDIK